MKSKKSISITIIILIIIFCTSLLIPSAFISNGVSNLPHDRQEYGAAAIRMAYSSLDNPIQRLMARRLQVLSVDINSITKELKSTVSVRSFWGIYFYNIELSGKINPQDEINMGFNHAIISKSF